MSSLVSYTLVVLLLAIVKANPIGKLIEYNNEVNLDGYNFGYIIDDGTARHETGKFVQKTGEDGSFSVNGDHGFTFPDGTKFELYFTADENGYHPSYRIGQRSSGPIGNVQSSPIPTAAIASLTGGGFGK